MRIAIDARKMDVPLTGIGRYTKNLLNKLASVDEENEYVILCGKKFNQVIPPAANFRSVVVDYPAFSVSSLFLLHRILHRERIDVFHSPFVSAPLLARCKVILTIHDLIPLRFSKGFGNHTRMSELFRKSIFRVILLMVTRRANFILADSRATMKALTQFEPSLADKTRVVYVAPDQIFQKMSNKEGAVKIKNKIAPQGRLILYVGVIRPHKNLIRLLEALNMLVNQGGCVYHLVICGGKEADSLFLKRSASKLGVLEHVSFIHHLNDAEIVSLMNAADVFVFPSLEEGFGLPPLEAMACGTPVIVSNLSSLPEVVGDAAMLIDPHNVREMGDALQQVLSNEQIRKELIKRGFERAKHFSWTKTAKETLQVYHEVANKKQ